MRITTTTRTAPTNYDCPKCGGHVWWDDTVRLVKQRRVRRWWNTATCTVEHCPEGEHVHRTHVCSRCGWEQTTAGES